MIVVESRFIPSSSLRHYRYLGDLRARACGCSNRDYRKGAFGRFVFEEEIVPAGSFVSCLYCDCFCRVEARPSPDAHYDVWPKGLRELGPVRNDFDCRIRNNTIKMLELDAFLRQKLFGFVVNVAERAGFLFSHEQTFEAEPTYDRSQLGEAPTSKYDFCRVLVIERFQLVSSLYLVLKLR